MTIPRFMGLLALFGGLGIAVVALRADQVRRSNHIQQLQFEQIKLQQTIWANDAKIARLRSPQMIRDRATRFAVPLLPPYEERSVLPRDEAWVAE
jgi:hypothetical protein